MKITVGTVKQVLGWFLFIAAAIVGVLFFMLGFSLLHGTLAGANDFFERSDFIIYITPGINFLIGLIVWHLILVVIIGIKLITPIEKQEIYFEEIDSTSNLVGFIEKILFKILCCITPFYLACWHFIGKNKAKILSFIFALSLLLGYYSLTNYSVLYEDNIVKHSFFYPNGKTYDWTDVAEVQVGVKENRHDYDYYYVIRFKDNAIIKLNEFTSSKLDSADAFLLIDHKVKQLGINKNIDKSNLEKWGIEYDQNYVKKILRLFED